LPGPSTIPEGSFLTSVTLLLLAAAVGDTARVRRIAVTPGDSVTVEVSGTGSPIVLMAGPIGGAFGFRQVVPALVTAGYQVLVIDPFDPANGGRQPPTLEDLARRWGSALATLELSQALFVAHSVSNTIALRLALLHPAMVRGMVSLEGGATEKLGQGGSHLASSLARLVKLPGGGRLVRHRIRGSLKERSASEGWITDDLVRAYARPFTSDPSRTLALMRSLAEVREGERLEPRLAGLRVPVLLLMGEARHPSRIGDAELAMMQGALPGLQVEAVPGSGHFLHEEQPALVTQWVLRRARSGAVIANSPPE
jgi:pimeloyl-ACP methyl ester carboxylesterase